MITIRKSKDRGHLNHGWLDTYHTFSFGEYRDPDHMGFSVLRVINEDRVAPGMGFPEHPHRDMEIITYVIEGELAHRDSTGGEGVIGPGRIQHMTAGRGVRHSEFNASKTHQVHLLQIWILPREKGLPPAYHERTFAPQERKNVLRLLASPDGGDGSLTIKQEASIYASLLDRGEALSHRFGEGRNGWIQVVRGNLVVNGVNLSPGDGGAIEGEESIEIAAEDDAEFLLFDLP